MSIDNSSDWISSPSSLRVRQEEQLVQNFRTILAEHIQSFRQSGGSWSLNESEQKVFKYLPIGWWQGALAGAVTLATLRVGPHHLARFLQKRSAPNSPFQKSLKRINPTNLKAESGIIYSLWWTLDIGLSLFAGMTIASVYTDHDRVKQDLASIPLLPGQSVLCHELCPIAMESMQTYQDSAATANLMHRPMTLSLQACQAAVRNCQRRSAYANVHRRSNALDTDTMVTVPPEGLPTGLEYLPLEQDAHGDVYNLKVWNTPRVSTTTTSGQTWFFGAKE